MLDPVLPEFDVGEIANEVATTGVETAGLAASLTSSIGGFFSDIWGGIKEILSDVWEAGGKQIAVDWLRKEILGDTTVKLSIPTTTTKRTSLNLTTTSLLQPTTRTTYAPPTAAYYPVQAYSPYSTAAPVYQYSSTSKSFLDELTKKPEYLIFGFSVLAALVILLANRD